MKFCPNCGKILRIWLKRKRRRKQEMLHEFRKRKNKKEYYYHCRNCGYNSPINDKMILVHAYERRNSRLKRSTLKELKLNRMNIKGGVNY